ncbi:MAG: DUF892 family protein [Bacteroidota bacterium]
MPRTATKNASPATEAASKKTAPKKTAPAKKDAAPAKADVLAKSPAQRPAAKSPAKQKISERDMLGGFFMDELKDIYWAEKHLVKALAKMEKAATAPALKNAFAGHRTATETHVARLEEVFSILGQKPSAKKCEAMAGLTSEADEIVSATDKGSDTRDVGLIFAAQKVEHYEIATYGCLAELARTLNLKGVPAILEKTLAEEKQTDVLLSKLAVRKINEEASHEKKDISFIDKVLNMVSGS